MSKAIRLFNLATMTSNAFGIESALAGNEATMFQSDDGANINHTVEDYVNNILVFAEILTGVKFDEFTSSLPLACENEPEEAIDTAYGSYNYEEIYEILGLIVDVLSYDPLKLACIARNDWAEQEGKAAMEA
jgi:hypothetical protein